MYAVECYQRYTLKLDMDHVTKIRKMVWELGYEDAMVKMDNFHDSLLRCVTNKGWMMDFFGKLKGILLHL